jgi:hypothetical protein
MTSVFDSPPSSLTWGKAQDMGDLRSTGKTANVNQRWFALTMRTYYPQHIAQVNSSKSNGAIRFAVIVRPVYGMVQYEVTVCRHSSLRESASFREANGDFALNLKFSTAQRHRMRAARTLHPSAQNGRSATSPDLVSTSACRPDNRNFGFAISQSAY